MDPLRIISILAITAIVLVIFTIIKGKNPTLPQMNTVSNAYKTKLDPSSPFTFQTKLNKKFKGFKNFLNKRIEFENKNGAPKDAKLLRGALCAVEPAFVTRFTNKW